MSVREEILTSCRSLVPRPSSRVPCRASLVPRPGSAQTITDLAHGLGRGTRDVGRGTWDEGPGTRDPGRGTRDEGPGTKDEGRGTDVIPQISLEARDLFPDSGSEIPPAGRGRGLRAGRSGARRRVRRVRAGVRTR